MRARNIKPGFWTNEDLGALPVEARLLFIGLWCYADREGRCEDRPARIRVAVLPYDAEIDCDGLLVMLAERGFIVRYEAAGKRYLQINNFTLHQSPHHTERQSEVPPPPEGVHREPTVNSRKVHKDGTVNIALESQNPRIPESQNPDMPEPITPPTPLAGGVCDEATPISRPIPSPAKSNGSLLSETGEELVKRWNEHAEKLGLPQVRYLGDKHKRALSGRLKSADWRRDWREALDKLPLLAPFYLGDGPRGWRADMEWFLRPNTVAKLLEENSNQLRPPLSKHVYTRSREALPI